MIYLDANVLIAGVSNVAGLEKRTEQTERLLRSNELLYASALGDYEARKSLVMFGDEHLLLLDSLLEKKIRLNANWDMAILQALKISRQFKERLAVDSADTLHVAWALALGADTFASFDRTSGPRPLALALGLKVWPKAGPKDFEVMTKLKPKRR